MATLTTTQRSTIKRSAKPAKALAEKYGVSVSTIYTVKNSEVKTATKTATKSTSKAKSSGRAKSEKVPA